MFISPTLLLSLSPYYSISQVPNQDYPHCRLPTKTSYSRLYASNLTQIPDTDMPNYIYQ